MQICITIDINYMHQLSFSDTNELNKVCITYCLRKINNTKIKETLISQGPFAYEYN